MEQKKEDGGLDDLISLYIGTAMKGKKEMTPAIAKAVVEACLKSFSERLLSKEKMIQNRIEKENKAIKKKQAQMTKAHEMLEKEEEEEQRKSIQEISFRKRILEQRMQKHQQSAQEKMSDLKKRVIADPRISPYIQSVLATIHTLPHTISTNSKASTALNTAHSITSSTISSRYH